MRNLILAAGLTVATLPAFANPTLEDVDSGLYELEKSHAFLTWSVKHNGISNYIVNFTDFDANLVFDAETPANSQLEVTINPAAMNTNYPDPAKKVEWETELATDARFLNASEFPAITFASTSVEQTGEFTGTVTGNLTFLGVTQPATLDVSYGGLANPPWFGQRDVIGFTASTTINRSTFGNTALGGVISDEVVIEFSGEFLQAEE